MSEPTPETPEPDFVARARAHASEPTPRQSNPTRLLRVSKAMGWPEAFLKATALVCATGLICVLAATGQNAKDLGDVLVTLLVVLGLWFAVG